MTGRRTQLVHDLNGAYYQYNFSIFIYTYSPAIILFLAPRSALPAAIVKVQATMRSFLARKRFWREYFIKLAGENAGSKEVSSTERNGTKLALCNRWGGVNQSLFSVH